jgi:hypothetical protein
MSVLRMLIPPKRLDFHHLNCLLPFYSRWGGLSMEPVEDPSHDSALVDEVISKS